MVLPWPVAVAIILPSLVNSIVSFAPGGKTADFVISQVPTSLSGLIGVPRSGSPFFPPSTGPFLSLSFFSELPLHADSPNTRQVRRAKRRIFIVILPLLRPGSDPCYPRNGGPDGKGVLQFEAGSLLVSLEPGILAGEESHRVPPFQRVALLNRRRELLHRFQPSLGQNVGDEDTGVIMTPRWHE